MIDNGRISEIDGNGLKAIPTRWVLTHRVKPGGATPDHNNSKARPVVSGDSDRAGAPSESPKTGGRTSKRVPGVMPPRKRSLGMTGDFEEPDAKKAFLQSTRKNFELDQTTPAHLKNSPRVCAEDASYDLVLAQRSFWPPTCAGAFLRDDEEVPGRPPESRGTHVNGPVDLFVGTS